MMDIGEGGTQEDRWPAHLDCNDNTAMIYPDERINSSEEDFLENQITPTSPHSNASEKNNLNAVMAANLSPRLTEDPTICSDYFYDDELPMGYEAGVDGGLSPEVERQLIQGFEINSLLDPAGENGKGNNFDNRAVGYQIENSEYDDGEIDMSQELSGSEQLESSCEISELRDVQLFSPPPSFQDPSQSSSVESFGQGSILSNSVSAHERFNYDWTANKNRYMVTLVSDESFHQSERDTKELQNASFTDWTLNEGHDLCVTTHATMSGSQTDTSTCKASSSNESRTTDSSSQDQKVVMTAWADTVQNKEKDQHQFVTWRSLQATKVTDSIEDPGSRSKSMPDIQGVEVEEPDQSHCDVESKRHSGLVQLFQKTKSQSDGSSGSCSPSDVKLQMLTGAWSMSPASSGRLSSCSQVSCEEDIQKEVFISESADQHPRLISWTTMKNLNEQQLLELKAQMDRKDDSSSSWATPMSGLTLSRQSQLVSPKMAADACVGSGIVTKSQVWGNTSKEASVQFPPNTMDCSIQTSFDAPRLQTFNHKPIIKTPCSKCLEPTKAVIRRPKVKLTNSVFYKFKNLPDLSFLQRGMTSSQVGRTSRRTSSADRNVHKEPHTFYNHRSSSLDSRKVANHIESCKSCQQIHQPSYSASCSSSSTSGFESGSCESIKRRKDSTLLEQAFKNLERKQHLCVICDRSLEDRNMSQSTPAYEGKTHFCLSPIKDINIFSEFANRKPENAQVAFVKTFHCGKNCSKDCRIHNEERKPLKSCLVKRRNRRKNLLKRRSLPDPYDLTVMKYSLEGQTRYQLVVPKHTKEDECVHGLSIKKYQVKSSHSQQEQTSAVPNFETVVCECSRRGPPPDVIRTSLDVVKTSPPDSIPVMPCPCQGSSTRASSSSSSASSSDFKGHPHVKFSSNGVPLRLKTQQDNNRSKKTVSFSEEVLYRSPLNSPGNGEAGYVCPTCCPNIDDKASSPPPQGIPVPRSTSTTLEENQKRGGGEIETDYYSEGEDTAPSHFNISPANTPPLPSSFTDSGFSSELAAKRVLVNKVIQSVDLVLGYFSSTTDKIEVMRLCSTSECQEIGQLFLKQLCPAIYSILADGLRPQTRSLFGKVRNNVWRLVEDSAEMGSTTRVVTALVRDLKSLDFLSTTFLKFNAFIFGLINHKALDFWLMYLHNNDDLLSKHYETDSFMQVSTGRGRHLFFDMTMALQSLAHLPFKLEYNFEYRLLQELSQQKLADYLLNKHVEGIANSFLSESFDVSYLRSMALRNSSSFTSSQNSQNNNRHPARGKEDGKQEVAASSTSSTTTSSSDSLPPQVHHIDEQSSSLSKKKSGMETMEGIFQSGTEKLSNIFKGSRASNKEDVGKHNTVEECYIPSTKPKRVPQVQGMINPKQQAFNIAPAKPRRAAQSVQIVCDNKILDQNLYEKPDQEQKEYSQGFLAKVAKHFQNPDYNDRVYKTGITEYKFDGIMDPLVKKEMKKDKHLEMKKEELELLSGFTGRDTEVLPDPSSSATNDSGIEEQRLDESKASAEINIPLRHLDRSDPSKRWSDSEATKWLAPGPGEKLSDKLKEVTKRWTTLPPSIATWFEKTNDASTKGDRKEVENMLSEYKTQLLSSTESKEPKCESIPTRESVKDQVKAFERQNKPLIPPPRRKHQDSPIRKPKQETSPAQSSVDQSMKSSLMQRSASKLPIPMKSENMPPTPPKPTPPKRCVRYDGSPVHKPTRKAPLPPVMVEKPPRTFVHNTPVTSASSKIRPTTLDISGKLKKTSDRRIVTQPSSLKKSDDKQKLQSQIPNQKDSAKSKIPKFSLGSSISRTHTKNPPKVAPPVPKKPSSLLRSAQPKPPNFRF